MAEPDPAIFVLAPRYARDIAATFEAAGLSAEVSTRAADASVAFARTSARVAVIDARGALAAGLVVAHELALDIEARHGAMLLLLARGDATSVKVAYAAGVTQVLSSPFGATDLVDATCFALRTATRLSDAAAGREASVESDDARRDLLTGLATAQQAQVWVELLLGGCAAGELAVIVMLIAVGRFGEINAAYGRAAADQLLVAAAARLRDLVSPASGGIGDGWLVARMAGAEFAVVLPSPVSLSDARQLATRIVAAFDAPFAVARRRVHLAVRIGIACGDPAVAADDDGPGLLFQHASASLAAARGGAPGCIEVFQTDPAGDPLARLVDLEFDLRRAIDGGEFQILYQPQVSLCTGLITGVEALVRWAHPVFGQLSAKTLLEVAASADLANQLGKHIRRRALDEAIAWPSALDGLQLSVNVSAGDLRASDFAERLDRALTETGFSPKRLTVEITESELIENLDGAALSLATLRARGACIALDDFGTGYSSLAYLKALPLDYLKLDKTLTADLEGSGRDRIIVKGIVEMAQALDMRVIAEGVETPRQLELVAAMRCDWYQGFHCSPPLTGAELVAFVADWNAARTGVEPALANG